MQRDRRHFPNNEDLHHSRINSWNKVMERTFIDPTGILVRLCFSAPFRIADIRIVAEHWPTTRRDWRAKEAY
jgi:hypothetical protein